MIFQFLSLPANGYVHGINPRMPCYASDLLWPLRAVWCLTDSLTGVLTPSLDAIVLRWMKMSRYHVVALLFLFQAVGGWKRSPTSRPSSRAESSEDLLSDSASVASDISDSSINSSLLGKRTLAPPTKVTHLFKTDLQSMFWLFLSQKSGQTAPPFWISQSLQSNTINDHIDYVCMYIIILTCENIFRHVYSIRVLWETCQVWKLHAFRAEAS